ncbi:unnamed protein product [Prunus armeniaca]
MVFLVRIRRFALGSAATTMTLLLPDAYSDEGDDLPLKLVTQGGLDGEAPNGQLLRIAVIHGHAPFLSPPNWSVLICDTKP